MACEECLRNCQLVHMRKKNLEPSFTRFIKIFIGKDVFDALCLPPKFAPNVADLVDKETVLEDSSGRHWTVTLSYYKSSLAFHKGWKEFSVDHDLRVGDFLVFNYFKGGHFVVQIFGSSCCERISYNRNRSPNYRAKTSENIAAQDILFQATNTNARQIKRTRTSEHISAQDVPFQATDTNNQPIKRGRTRGKVAVQDTPYQKTDIHAVTKQCMSPSVPSVSNLECIKLQPSTRNDTLRPEGGNADWFCLDSAFDLMIKRDAGHAESESRTGLYDLSIFEMQQSELPAGKNKKAVVGEGTPSDAWTSVRSQPETDLVDTKTIGTTVPKIAKPSKVTGTGMIDNEKDFGPMDNVSIKIREVCSDGPSSGLPLDTSAKLGVNCERGDDIQKLFIPQSANSNEWKTHFADQYASFRCNAEQPEQELTGLEQSTGNEHDEPSPAPTSLNAVKMEPFDSLDSITCLAVSDGCDVLELPHRMPSISFPKGRLKAKCVLLQDPEKRTWPAVYYEKYRENCNFFILVCGWKKFNEANGIQPGDQYMFSIEDESQFKFKVDVLSK